MFNKRKKNTITICGNGTRTVDVERVINSRKVKIYGVVETLIEDDKFYTTVTVNMTVNEVAELLTNTLEKNTRTRIQGSIIFLEEES